MALAVALLHAALCGGVQWVDLGSLRPGALQRPEVACTVRRGHSFAVSWLWTCSIAFSGDGGGFCAYTHCAHTDLVRLHVMCIKACG